jgi:CBS domain-containing protein
MRLRDVLRHKGSEVVTIAPDRTVHDAIAEMNRHKIGALVVTDQTGEIQGIVTERDVLRMCGEQCVHLDDPSLVGTDCPILVSEIMTTDLVIVVPDDTLDYAMGVMTSNRVRHLPVLDEGRRLAGVVSIGDVVKVHLNEVEYENRMLKDYIQGVISY